MQKKAVINSYVVIVIVAVFILLVLLAIVNKSGDALASGGKGIFGGLG